MDIKIAEMGIFKIVFCLTLSQFLQSQSHRRTVNLDSTGDISLSQDSPLRPCSPFDTITFISQRGHKAIVPAGGVFNASSWACSCITFCGNAVLEVEPKARISLSGQKIIVQDTARIIFTPPGS